MRGLGDGLGHVFPFKNEELQQYTSRLMERNSEFAIGLGIGLRYSFTYLSAQSQQEIKHRAEENITFAYGLGIGLGCVFVYLNDSLKNDLYEMAERNDQFAIGLGAGLSNLFTFANKDFQGEIFKKAEKNSNFMRGLGTGLGKVFPFIDKESQSELFTRAQNDVKFAIGLGEGFGHIFLYLNKEIRDKMLEDLDEWSSNKSDEIGNTQDHNFTRKGNGFGRGLGIGLGKNFAYIRKDLEFRIFAKASINVQFAIGLGEGLGYVFSSLGDELQSKILQRSEEYPLARGLGIGLGHVLYYLHNNKKLQDKIFEDIDKNKIFAKSIAISLNHSFSSLIDHRLIQKILPTPDQKFDYIENEFNDYPTIGLPNNTYYYCTNKENGITDDNVVDDEMKEYLQMVINEMKNKAVHDRMNNL